MTRPRRTVPLSADDHRRTGAQLYAARRQLDRALADTADHLPKNSPGRIRLMAAVRALDVARSVLDDLFKYQHPQDFDVRAYYPGSETDGPR